MQHNIDRNEFEQYERRIDEKFETLNDKINNLPNIIEDKMKYQIADMKKGPFGPLFISAAAVDQAKPVLVYWPATR